MKKIKKNGNELGTLKKYNESNKEYEKALEIVPFFFEAIDNMAFNYMEVGDYDTAMIFFNESYNLNPESFTAFFSIGECLYKLDKFQEAIEIFQNGIIKYPEQKNIFDKFLILAKNELK